MEVDSLVQLPLLWVEAIAWGSGWVWVGVTEVGVVVKTQRGYLMIRSFML